MPDADKKPNTRKVVADMVKTGLGTFETVTTIPDPTNPYACVVHAQGAKYRVIVKPLDDK